MVIFEQWPPELALRENFKGYIYIVNGIILCQLSIAEVHKFLDQEPYLSLRKNVQICIWIRRN